MKTQWPSPYCCDAPPRSCCIETVPRMQSFCRPTHVSVLTCMQCPLQTCIPNGKKIIIFKSTITLQNIRQITIVPLCTDHLLRYAIWCQNNDWVKLLKCKILNAISFIYGFLSKRECVCKRVNMNAFTKFHENQSSSCQDISPEITHVNLLVSRAQKIKDYQSH